MSEKSTVKTVEMEDNKLENSGQGKSRKPENKESAKSGKNYDINVVGDEDEEYKMNYGDITLAEYQSTTDPSAGYWRKTVDGRTKVHVSDLSEDKEESLVLLTGHVHNVRGTKKLVFLILREKGYSVQCIARVCEENKIGGGMLKFIRGISCESFVEVLGVVCIPKEPIISTTQTVEINIRKLFCIRKALPVLPFSVEDASRPPDVSANAVEDASRPPDVSANAKASDGPSVTQENRCIHRVIDSICEQHKMVIPNNHNENLVGLLHETGSREIVILCHGFNSNKNNVILNYIAIALEKEGISAFRFDFSGNGESQGSFNYENYKYEADDLHSVVQYFTKTKRTVSSIIGHSRGANVVLLYASKYCNADIQNVISISGRYDLKKGVRLGDGFMERIKEHGYIDAKEGKFKFRVNEESLMARLNTNMHEACLKIGKECRVLTVHGSEDKVVPMEDAKEFAKSIPNHKMEIIQGANHGYTKQQSQLVSIVLEFLKNNK